MADSALMHRERCVHRIFENLEGQPGKARTKTREKLKLGRVFENAMNF